MYNWNFYFYFFIQHKSDSLGLGRRKQTCIISTIHYLYICLYSCVAHLIFRDSNSLSQHSYSEKAMAPHSSTGKSHGQRSLVGCGPWGRKESDMTERLPFHFSLSCIGEVNGNPLQCSCLENPRDGGAWWTAVYGVTQSQTRLK